LYNEASKIGTFVVSHLEEQAQTSKVAIAMKGLITIIARALGFGCQVDNLLALCTPGHIDVVTYINVKLFKTIDGGQI